MAALNNDTRLVMTILFVGTVSGANVYFYSAYGLKFSLWPTSPFSSFIWIDYSWWNYGYESLV